MAAPSSSPAASALKDRIQAKCSTFVDNYANLLRAAKVQEAHQQQERGAVGRVPGELQEVFAEKMLGAARALLAVTADMKRNALLNDVAARNQEVEAARRGE